MMGFCVVLFSPCFFLVRGTCLCERAGDHRRVRARERVPKLAPPARPAPLARGRRSSAAAPRLGTRRMGGNARVPRYLYESKLSKKYKCLEYVSCL